MKYIVNFSGGLCSFWAAHRSIERHGKENVVLLFADTLIEDGDLYDFNRHAETVLGIPITRICVGLKPWELFEREGLIGNNRFPICSTKLKREPLNEWMASHYEMEPNQNNAFYEPATVVLGFDWTEHYRVEEFQAEHPAWRVEAPMTEEPIWDKCRMRKESEQLGFKVPRLYQLGFPHNNCGGGCVRAGISHWVHLHRTLPEVFTQWEQAELKGMAALQSRGIEPMSMLKDRRGGEAVTLTLAMLRTRIEAGEKLPKHDWGGCGCGGASGTVPGAEAEGGTK